MANVAGDWDMDWCHISLLQSGTSVTGTYNQWGYQLTDQPNAGTITGTVSGNTITGTFDNNENSGNASFTLTLGAVATNGASVPYLYGNWTFGGTYPWCGVPAGQGNALPQGCGWSDSFGDLASSDGPIVLTQVADEVTGSYAEGTLAGVVSDYRLNGVMVSGAGVTGRFSYWWTDETEHAFQGNYSLASSPTSYSAWCANRNTYAMPTSCAGGGGLYDGTWFTNLGVLNVVQPLVTTATPLQASGTASLVWYPWGSSTTSRQENVVTNATVTASGLSWTDGSGSSNTGPGGGNDFVVSFVKSGTAYYALAIAGSGLDGTYWCGAQYATDPNNGFGDPLGTLPQGCGLSNGWTFWESGSASTGSNALSQYRGTVSGFTDNAGAISVTGNADFSSARMAGESWIYFAGTWYDNGASSGSFDWYPNGSGVSFAGDYTSTGVLGQFYPWCAANSFETGFPTQPNPCQQ